MSKYKLVPILPVPETVFYPHTVLPLHVVEPAYVKMIRNAVEEGSLIGVTLAEPVGESQGLLRYSPKRVFGAGKPFIIEETEHRTLKVLIQGVSRMQMVSIHQELPYLIYEAEELEDVGEEGFFSMQYKIERLMDILDQWLVENIDDSIEREDISENFESLNHIVDYSCFLLIHDPSTRQLLLENTSISERVRLLNSLLRAPNHLIEDAIVANAIKEYETIEKTAKVGH